MVFGFITNFFAKLKHYRIAFSIAPPKNPRFWDKDVPDLTGRVAVVTGGNRGCGYVTVRGLAAKGCRVYIAVRDVKKGKEAAEKVKEEIKAQSGVDADVEVLELELADLFSVKKAAEELKKKEKYVHIIVSNAGVQDVSAADKTKQGYGVHFGINALGHFVFTNELLPTLLETAKDFPKGSVRVVNVASSAHYFAPKVGIDWDDLNNKAAQVEPNGKPWHHMKAYGHSKLANILLAKEMARRYSDRGIYCISIHPGNILTLFEDNWLAKSMLWPLEYGSVNTLYAATSPEIVEEDLNGKYIVPWARVYPPHPHGEDEEVAKKLWVWCEEQEKEVFSKN